MWQYGNGNGNGDNVMAMAAIDMTFKVETDNYERYLEYIGAGKMTVNFTLIQKS